MAGIVGKWLYKIMAGNGYIKNYGNLWLIMEMICSKWLEILYQKLCQSFVHFLLALKFFPLYFE
jgi:hypothetical protein